MKITKYRDLTLISFGDKQLVVACDSSGGIGPKDLDVIKVEGYIVGRFLTRVVLMELLSIGAEPISLVDTLSVEMNPTGVEIIRGIIDEAKEAKVNVDAILNGSTEENIPVQQTGVGITALGQGEKLVYQSYCEDIVVCIGYPKVGDEVVLGDPDICDLSTVYELRQMAGVHEIVPVGSKGVGYELNELLGRNNLIMKNKNIDFDYQKAGGPATCIIVTLVPNLLNEVQKFISQPMTILGNLVSDS